MIVEERKIEKIIESPKVRIVDIKPEQIKYAKKIALKIRYQRRKKYNDKGGNSRKNSKKISYIGFLGEVIFADTFNLERPKLEEDKDKGIDFILNNKTYQIKTTDKLDFGLTLFPNERFISEYYVLINLNIKEKKAIINNQFSRRQIQEEYEEVDFGYGKRLYIDKLTILKKGTYIN